MNGATLFARFALPPNELGYCGPGDTTLVEELLRAGDAGLEDLRHTAESFAGAWPYLELIAGCHGLDPLDPTVVEAYWLGNDLLDSIDLLTWGNSLEARFRGRAGGDFSRVGEAAWRGGAPTHAFHVFCVYPWVGLLRGGVPGPALRVIDRCRIRTGRVLGAEGERLIVSSRHLEWTGRRLELGPSQVEVAICTADQLPVPGELVALHWGHVCVTISEYQFARTRAIEDRHLALANRETRTLAGSIEA